MKNERKQSRDLAGVVGDSALRKIDRGTWDAREEGGTQRRREAITERRPKRESAGLIVARKRGNARGAKEPYHSELE